MRLIYNFSLKKKLFILYNIIIFSCFFGCDTKEYILTHNFSHSNGYKNYKGIPHKQGRVIIHSMYTVPADLYFRDYQCGFINIKPEERLRVYRIDLCDGTEISSKLMHNYFEFYLRDETAEEPLLKTLKERGAAFSIARVYQSGHHRILYRSNIRDVEWLYDVIKNHPWDHDDDTDMYDED